MIDLTSSQVDGSACERWQHKNISQVYTRRKKIIEACPMEQTQIMEQECSSTDSKFDESLVPRRGDVDPLINLHVALRKEERSKAGKLQIDMGLKQMA